MKTSQIEKSIKEALDFKFKEEDFQDCYNIEVQISNGNKVIAFIESTGDLTLGRCQKLSRHLEKLIEENNWFGEKYTLEVSSPGLDRPLVDLRQYVKNIGRNIKVKVVEGETVEGRLSRADEEGIEIVVKEKKKEKQVILQYDNIMEAKILVSFK